MKKTMAEKFKEWHAKLSPDEEHLFKVRNDLIQRCYNKNCKAFRYYGGRGIRVCDEWRQSWRPFVDWALSHGYQQGLQIDRRDNNGDYTPENCRFVTAKENDRNKRNNRPITLRGETRLLIEWGERLNIGAETLRKRMDKYGWSVERTLTTPVRAWGRNRKTINRVNKIIKKTINQNTNKK